jgi:phasin family protein
MMTDIVTGLGDKCQALVEPVRALNERAVADMQKLAESKMSSLQCYAGMGVEQMQAAAGIRDLDGLKAYMGKQGDMMTAIAERMVTDAGQVAQVSVGFLNEAMKLGQRVLTLPVASAA